MGIEKNVKEKYEEIKYQYNIGDKYLATEKYKHDVLIMDIRFNCSNLLEAVQNSDMDEIMRLLENTAGLKEKFLKVLPGLRDSEANALKAFKADLFEAVGWDASEKNEYVWNYIVEGYHSSKRIVDRDFIMWFFHSVQIIEHRNFGIKYVKEG